MKKLAVSIAFFVILAGVACAEGNTPKVVDLSSDNLTKFVVAMAVSFVGGIVVALGFKKK